MTPLKVGGWLGYNEKGEGVINKVSTGGPNIRGTSLMSWVRRELNSMVCFKFFICPNVFTVTTSNWENMLLDWRATEPQRAAKTIISSVIQSPRWLKTSDTSSSIRSEYWSADRSQKQQLPRGNTMDGALLTYWYSITLDTESLLFLLCTDQCWCML